MTRPQWIDDVDDVTEKAAQALGMYTLKRLAGRLGLAPRYIKDKLSRPVITNRDNPMFHICRPAARIGVEPLFTPDQLAGYLLTQDAQLTKRDPLPVKLWHECETLGLAGYAEISQATGLHVGTLKKYADDADDFPRPVARCEPRGGLPGNRPQMLNPQAVLDFLVEHGKIKPGWYTVGTRQIHSPQGEPETSEA